MAIGLAPRLGPRRTPGNRKKYMGRSRLYLRKGDDSDASQHQISVTKDVDASDVHITTAIGNSRGKRKRRMPIDIFKAWSDEARIASAEARRQHGGGWRPAESELGPARQTPHGSVREWNISPEEAGRRLRRLKQGGMAARSETVRDNLVRFRDSLMSKAWSDEAREASAESRRGNGKGRKDTRSYGAKRFHAVAGGVSGVASGGLVGAVAGAGINAAGRKIAQRGAARGPEGLKRKMSAAENLASRPGTAGEKQAAEAGAERLRQHFAAAGGRTARPGIQALGRALMAGARHVPVAGVIAGAAYGAYRGYNAVSKAFDPTQERDEHGRWVGNGEPGIGQHLGRLAGWGAGATQARRIYRNVQNRLSQPATYNTKRFSVTRQAFKWPGRIGLGLLAAYGAVRVGGAVGGYVGSKIDDAVARIS